MSNPRNRAAQYWTETRLEALRQTGLANLKPLDALNLLAQLKKQTS